MDLNFNGYSHKGFTTLEDWRRVEELNLRLAPSKWGRADVTLTRHRTKMDTNLSFKSSVTR